MRQRAKKQNKKTKQKKTTKYLFRLAEPTALAVMRPMCPKCSNARLYNPLAIWVLYRCRVGTALLNIHHNCPCAVW